MLKVEQTYNFIDMLGEARKSNITLKEQVLRSEDMFEDPRVPKAFGDEYMVFEAEKRSQELFFKKAQRLLGESLDIDFGDNAPIGAFATNQLERLDMQIRKQALRTYAFRDVPIKYGGGALESIKAFRESYSLPKGGFIGGDTNEVRVPKIAFKAQKVPVKPLAYGLELGHVDKLKDEMLGFDRISAMHQVIQKAWALDIDRIAYVGERGEDGGTSDTNVDYPGLLNLSATTYDLETDATLGLGVIKRLESLDINTVIGVFTKILNNTAMKVDFTAELMPNKLLFYKELFAWLNSTAQNATGVGTPFRTNRAILQEAIDSWCETQGFDKIRLEMLPYLSADITGTKDASMVNDGTNNTGRIVGYRQDEYTMYLPLPMDLTGGAIVYDPRANAFRKNYLSFVGYLMWFDYENVFYIDNGTSTGE